MTRTRSHDMSSATEIIEKAQDEGRAILTEMESKQLLRSLGIATTEMKLATSEQEAVALSREIGYPCVLKVSSPDITHKSDAGGVKVGLTNEVEVAQAYQAIMSACREKFPDAVIEGVTVQNMARPGLEVIVGMATDPQFGPVLMFGLGGVWVEVLKDVSFKIVPLTKHDAAKRHQGDPRGRVFSTAFAAPIRSTRPRSRTSFCASRSSSPRRRR